MAKTQKEKLQQQIDKLQDRRNKTSDTFTMVRLTNKIVKLKKQLNNE